MARLAVLGSLACSPAAFADEPEPTVGATTMPTNPVPLGQPQPQGGQAQGGQAQVRDDQARVAVLTFVPGSREAETQGLGGTVQQSLATELGATQGLRPVTVTATDHDLTNVSAAAAEANARYAVFGNVQAVGGTVRITGQVYDVQNDRTVAPLRASGTVDNYFQVQDQFVEQAVQVLQGGGPATAAGPVGNATQPGAQQPGLQQQQQQSPYAQQPQGYPQQSGAMAAVLSDITTNTSHWGDAQYYYVQAAQAPAPNYPPPTPPAPPMFGGVPPVAGYGGGYYDPGYYFYGAPYSHKHRFGLPLGTVRTELLGGRGVSIIPPSPTRTIGYGGRPAASFYTPSRGPVPIPAYNPSIRAYKNPWKRFAAPVGLPQRAAPPNLRPGAASPAAATK